MAQDYTSLIMADGAKQWNKKPPAKPKVDKTPERRRNGILKQIDKILSTKAAPRGWTVVREDITLAMLRSGTREVRFPGGALVEVRKGKQSWGAFVPSERVSDFYKLMRPVVAANKLDKEIAAAWEGAGAAKGSAPGEGRRKPRGPMSEETKAKIRAAKAANKAG